MIKKCILTAFNGFVLSLINWSFFVIIGILILEPYFSIFTANTEVASLGLKYLNIILLFSIAPFTENVAVRILQATGNTILPMIFQSTAALLNLILDPVFIWGFGVIPAMGISGAAIATVLSQFLSATLAVITVFFKQTVLTVSFRIPSFDLIKEIFVTGLPSVLGMALVSAYISGLNAVLARFSEDAVSSLGIYYKLQTFLLIPTYGLNQGVTPLWDLIMVRKNTNACGILYGTALPYQQSHLLQVLCVFVCSHGKYCFSFTLRTA